MIMEANAMLIIVMAIIMMIVYGFFDALRIQITTGEWDVGYLAATFIYSVIVGVVAGLSGMLDMTVPVAEWWTVLGTVFAAYLGYLTILHSVMDYILAKIFPEKAPQGLGTAFMPEKKRQTLIRK
jgi:phage shock protein PspC (stress-responsive transcriptional regulator)